MKNIKNIQVGDKPGWDKPALNVLFKDGTAVSIPVTLAIAEAFISQGASVEG